MRIALFCKPDLLLLDEVCLSFIVRYSLHPDHVPPLAFKQFGFERLSLAGGLLANLAAYLTRCFS